MTTTTTKPLTVPEEQLVARLLTPAEFPNLFYVLHNYEENTYVVVDIALRLDGTEESKKSFKALLAFSKEEEAKLFREQNASSIPDSYEPEEMTLNQALSLAKKRKKFNIVVLMTPKPDGDGWHYVDYFHLD